MSTLSKSLALFAFGLLLTPASVRGETPPKPPTEPNPAHELYEKKVRPILAQHCFKCHSHQEGRFRGGLVVDSIGGLIKGGDSGAAVVPGKVAESPLIEAVRYEGLEMPPDGKRLSEAEIAVLVDWVERGAQAPGLEQALKAGRSKITDEDRAWWAIQPVQSPAVPASGEKWAKNELDRFIHARLAAEGLQPAPAADRRALIRRVYFDLTGLPPTPDEVDAFVADDSPEAYERLVDRLLASPRYGERWARHWLDLVRYAESDGFRIDDHRPTAWRYRDYVIRAFNDDKPYNRFVAEQLAGDEIAPGDPDALTATGFLRHTIYEYNQRDVRTQWSDMLNDLTDTTGDVFLGLGMQCARCHDHKFDPILQADYYRLQSFFAAFLPLDEAPLATPEQLAEYETKLAKWKELTADIRKQIEEIENPKKQSAARNAIEKFPDDLQEMINKPVAERSPLEHQLAELAYRQVTYEYGRLESKMKDEEKHKLAALRRDLAAFDKDKPAPLPTGRVAVDAGPKAPPVRIPKKDGPDLAPGVLTILDPKPLEFDAAKILPASLQGKSTGRRAALAQWITRADNPLSTRVIVNRIWQYHFGRGLAANTSDLGRLGEKPSHPELLDWLATRFVADGWSLKKLHRLIVTSATYRQSATAPAPQTALLKDPENRLLWRANTRRLDAEQIRDAILATTGELDLTMGGPAADATKPRRSVYTRALRNTRDPLLEVFDLPEGFVSNAQRNVTTTATQALLLFNGQSFLRNSKAMSDRLSKLADADQKTDKKKDPQAAFVVAAYRAAYGRLPTSAEVSAAKAFMDDQAQRANPQHKAGSGFVSEKLPYREGKAALFQPAGPQVHLVSNKREGLPTGDFTVEAFVLLRSLHEDGTVRNIASQTHGNKSQPGWAFGVTSKKSRYKPQTLVLQLWRGPVPTAADGKPAELDYEPIFSGLHIALNKPYFVAVSVKMQDTGEAGVTFFAKDLSNDDEPMLSARAPHQLTQRGASTARFAIGGLDQPNPKATFDGLIDDVRLSSRALQQEELLFTADAVTNDTVGYWQFEARPNPYHDASGSGREIASQTSTAKGQSDAQASARVDFCHVLLNSNEFLYVD